MRADAASFRDPSGQVYHDGERVLRVLSSDYLPHYKKLMTSGLYDALKDRQWLVAHEEVNEGANFPGSALVLQADLIPIISYPQEWGFSYLKEAALLCLRIQRLSMEHGMILKDATPYNVQFKGSRAVWIDTLSFEKYQEGMSWAAYYQFCATFLAPLSVMAFRDLRMNMLRMFPDGLPLDLAVSLIPSAKRRRAGIWLNLVAHARLQKRASKETGEITPAKNLPRTSLLGHIDMLEQTIKALKPAATKVKDWADYYGEHHSEEYRLAKENCLRSLLREQQFQTLYDLGANTGLFSRIAADHVSEVIALEQDPYCVEALAENLIREASPSIMALHIDLTNPVYSPGWAGTERPAIWQRKKGDVILALALLHHLTIGANVTYAMLAAFFCKFGRELLIEFIPTDDPYASRMLKGRDHMAERLTKEIFLKEFSVFWNIISETPLAESKRSIFHYTRKDVE